MSLNCNEHQIEVNSVVNNDSNYSTDLNGNDFHEKASSILNRFKCLSLNIEKRGIERILPEERNDSTILNTAMVWVGANITIPCFAVGTLGPSVFQLSLYQSFFTIILFNLIGILPVAGIACFGPASGLRTMIFSRYSWGYYGASMMSIFNITVGLGWAAINAITGAQTLRVVSDDKLPVTIGIIIIGIITMVVSFVGYQWIHTYERYSWIPVFITFSIVAILGGKYFTHLDSSSFANESLPTHNNVSEGVLMFRVLNFGISCFGGAVSWCSFAADYNTYFPENTSQLKIFFFTYMGNLLSIVPLQLLGAAVYTGTYTNPNWDRAYKIDNIGGLLGASLASLGAFRKCLLVLFSLSTIAGNIPNIYSLSLSAQTIATIFNRIPRFFYTVLGTIIYILLGIVAENRFNDSLISFMDVLSYCFSIYIVIVFQDHLLFRRFSYKNYDFNLWDNRHLLPISFSAILSAFIGIIGIILGMSQDYFTGPIAKAIINDNNQEHLDLGFECGFIFTAITFPLFRFIELRFIKR